MKWYNQYLFEIETSRLEAVERIFIRQVKTPRDCPSYAIGSMKADIRLYNQYLYGNAAKSRVIETIHKRDKIRLALIQRELALRSDRTYGELLLSLWKGDLTVCNALADRIRELGYSEVTARRLEVYALIQSNPKAKVKLKSIMR